MVYWVAGDVYRMVRRIRLLRAPITSIPTGPSIVPATIHFLYYPQARLRGQAQRPGSDAGLRCWAQRPVSEVRLRGQAQRSGSEARLRGQAQWPGSEARGTGGVQVGYRRGTEQTGFHDTRQGVTPAGAQGWPWSPCHGHVGFGGLYYTPPVTLSV